MLQSCFKFYEVHKTTEQNWTVRTPCSVQLISAVLSLKTLRELN